MLLSFVTRCRLNPIVISHLQRFLRRRAVDYIFLHGTWRRAFQPSSHHGPLRASVPQRRPRPRHGCDFNQLSFSPLG